MYEFCKLIHGRMNSMVVKTNTMTMKMKHETLDPILEKKTDNFNLGCFLC